jgi:RHS repeat-associated protein
VKAGLRQIASGVVLAIVALLGLPNRALAHQAKPTSVFPWRAQRAEEERDHLRNPATLRATELPSSKTTRVSTPLGKTDGALRAGELGQQSELDVIGNVRRVRGGPQIPGFLQRHTDLGGYKYTAFGKLLPPDAGTPSPAWNPLGTDELEQPLRWQGRPFVDVAGGIYDFRNRWWSPELGAFLSPDELDFVTREGTLWSWPGQNPFRNADPFGQEEDPRAPLVSFLNLVGFGDTAAVIVGHQNALDAIAAGNVDAAECEARAILAASAALAVGAVIAAATRGLVTGQRADRFTVRRFLSKSELKELRKGGVRFDPTKGSGIPTTTRNFNPANQDIARSKTGARSAEYFVDLDVTGVRRGPQTVTRSGLPEYPIQGDLTPQMILDYGRVPK